jgi:predicted enzyme related to lactoylglutathione lyase
MTARATGIGGFFFRAKNPEALGAWYERHFGITPVSAMPWATAAGMTVFAPFQADTDYFPARSSFMLNLRVEGIGDLIAALEADGTVVRRLPDETYGIFAHCEDPEGNPLELWQPSAK